MATRRELKGKPMEKLPFVAITATVKGMFLGRLLNKDAKAIEVGLGTKYLYEFSIEDVKDLPIQKATDRKDEEGKTIYEEVKVQQGDRVNVFATKPLHEKLSMAENGELIEIIYNGKKPTQNKKNKFHDFNVNVLEEA